MTSVTVTERQGRRSRDQRAGMLDVADRLAVFAALTTAVIPARSFLACCRDFHFVLLNTSFTMARATRGVEGAILTTLDIRCRRKTRRRSHLMKPFIERLQQTKAVISSY